MNRNILQKLYKIKFFKRIIPSLLKKFIKISNKNLVVVNYNNSLICLNLFNPIDREIYLKGNYESEQLEFLSDLIDRSKINYFLDIGAHMGFYTILLSNKNIKTFSFEPIKENFNQLEENKRLNNLKNVTLYNFALSDVSKEITMWVTDKKRTGGYSIFDKQDNEIAKYKDEELFKIQTVSKRCDDILKIKNDKIAIKIDVERHEQNVLEGMREILKNNMVILQVEIFDDRKDKILKYLKSKGFDYINKIKKDYYFTNF